MSRPHRSETYYNGHSPPLGSSRLRPRHRDDRSHHHHRRSSFHSQHDSVSSHGKYTGKYNAPSYYAMTRPSTAMYADTKATYPQLRSDYPQRYSDSPHDRVITRRASSDDSDSDSSDDEPPHHAHLNRSKRHSTFPHTTYHGSHQKQLQTYRQHPAIPPAAPVIAPASHPGHRYHQVITRDHSLYEEPRYIYQPPRSEDRYLLDRPDLGPRSETWSHSQSPSRHSSSKPRSRQGSRSVPRRSQTVDGRHRDDSAGPDDGQWRKTKKLVQNKTVLNTAEIAMFGLMALSKAL
jgi:hypothetical protein